MLCLLWRDAARATGPLLALVCLLSPACSIFSGEEPPRRSPDFAVVPSPVAVCGEAAFAPNCGLAYGGRLTDRSTRVEGVAPNETEILRLVFDNGRQQFDLYHVGPVGVPLAVGSVYQVTVELTPTATLGYGSFEVTDAEGLVLFANTVLDANDAYSPPPPAGWRVWTEAAGYEEEVRGCGVRGTPRRLVVQHGGASVSLVQGQSARLGAFAVMALVAEAVDYADLDCLDYVAPELSYVIARRTS